MKNTNINIFKDIEVKALQIQELLRDFEGKDPKVVHSILKIEAILELVENRCEIEKERADLKEQPCESVGTKEMQACNEARQKAIFDHYYEDMRERLRNE